MIYTFSIFVFVLMFRLLGKGEKDSDNPKFERRVSIIQPIIIRLRPRYRTWTFPYNSSFGRVH